MEQTLATRSPRSGSTVKSVTVPRRPSTRSRSTRKRYLKE
jgi:hypothetical protein